VGFIPSTHAGINVEYCKWTNYIIKLFDIQTSQQKLNPRKAYRGRHIWVFFGVIKP
jgi:hypothetical protein